MRIGIVTLWNTTDNYGGILQTYALQRYLRNQGHKAYVIRFLIDGSLYYHLRKIAKRTLIKLHIIKSDVKYSRMYMVEKKAKLRNFNDFMKKHIACTPLEYHNVRELRIFPPHADVYITGSDQVWAGTLSNPNEAFHYLDFGNNNVKRISYAASFGHDTFPKEDVEQFKKYINRFYKISVREESGKSICESMGFNVVRCVDSTMLLKAEDYIGIMTPRKHDFPYVYLYSVNMSSASEIYWNALSKEFKKSKLKTIVTSASGYMLARELFNDVEYDYASPSEWLSNLYYSNLVITSSFHGVVFSLILRKQFIYFPLKSSVKSGNDRITDLLELVNLMDRVANSEDEAIRLANNPIDYVNVVFSPLDNLIDKSKDFLNF